MHMKYSCYTRRINDLLRILICHSILGEFIFWTKKRKSFDITSVKNISNIQITTTLLINNLFMSGLSSSLTRILFPLEKCGMFSLFFSFNWIICKLMLIICHHAKGFSEIPIFVCMNLHLIMAFLSESPVKNIKYNANTRREKNQNRTCLILMCFFSLIFFLCVWKNFAYLMPALTKILTKILN